MSNEADFRTAPATPGLLIIFAEKFVSQDFTIRAAPGLSAP